MVNGELLYKVIDMLYMVNYCIRWHTYMGIKIDIKPIPTDA
jgi:hypothetical protein